MQFVKRIVFVVALVFSCSVFADPQVPASPWFTGPLLAPSGTTFPKGHIGFQPYVFYTDDYGVYNNRWKRENLPDTHTVNPMTAIFIGLTDKMDLEIVLNYFSNSRNGVSNHGFGDSSVEWGYQILKGVLHTATPDLKFTITEEFPMGKYENLNPANNGTDATGSGSFETTFGLTFQKLWAFVGGHFLRARWNFSYTIPANVTLNGFSTYGGAANTSGRIKLGNHFGTDLAFEYTLTRNWVPAIDFAYTVSAKNSFSGNPGTTALGLSAPISTVSSESFSIAPAIEYNINGNMGVIAGVWFGVTGRNTPEFISYVVSFDISL